MKVIRVRKGENRVLKAQKISRKLEMKHISRHEDGFQVRISKNKRMYYDWVPFSKFETEKEALREAQRKRDRLLKKLKKEFSVKNVLPPLSNTGYKGITYRKNAKYRKRGKEYTTSYFEVRWWSAKEARFKKTSVSVRRNGGYRKALRKALEVQREKENAEANQNLEDQRWS